MYVNYIYLSKAFYNGNERKRWVNIHAITVYVTVISIVIANSWYLYVTVFIAQLVYFYIGIKVFEYLGLNEIHHFSN